MIFDLDGVLIASGPAHASSWKVVARRHGIVLTDAQFRETFGLPSRDIIRQLWSGAPLSDEQVRAIDDEKEAAYRELVSGMLPLMIGARELLARLTAAGHPLAIATSGPPENLDLFLDESRLRPHFAALVHGRDIHAGKPAPDCFLLAAERLGRAPGECVVVEDAPVGIAAALAAEIPPIALIGTHPVERLEECRPAAIVRSLAEIDTALVGRLARR